MALRAGEVNGDVTAISERVSLRPECGGLLTSPNLIEKVGVRPEYAGEGLAVWFFHFWQMNDSTANRFFSDLKVGKSGVCLT